MGDGPASRLLAGQQEIEGIGRRSTNPERSPAQSESRKIKGLGALKGAKRQRFPRESAN